jgi:hypothetical protein
MRYAIRNDITTVCGRLFACRSQANDLLSETSIKFPAKRISVKKVVSPSNVVRKLLLGCCYDEQTEKYQKCFVVHDITKICLSRLMRVKRIKMETFEIIASPTKLTPRYFS